LRWESNRSGKMNKNRLFIMLVILISMFMLWEDVAQADIVLKTMVVNPSQTRTQTTTLKAYLPYEAKPDDIIDMGDLEIDYDIGEGLYYVYKVVELAPGESVVREIRLRDIWIISQSEIEGFSQRARELVESLKKSAHFQTAISLSEDIAEKQADIVRTQTAVSSALPQTRIGTYRQNMKKIEAIKASIAELERLFFEHKIADATGAPPGRISVEKSWAVILGVIASLGILSLVFFIIWHKQAGILKTRKQDGSPDDEIDA
jgi:hypothetical protein